MYPSDFHYTEEHEWLKIDGDECIVGITDFAQKELGEVVFVDLPNIGDTFDEGDEIGTIESVKAVGEIYTPLAGEVMEVNDDLDETPELVNDEPHAAGWLCKLRIDPTTDFSGMMDAEAYADFIEKGDD